MTEKVTLEILTKLAGGGTGGEGGSSNSDSKGSSGIFGAVKSIAGLGILVAGVLSLLKEMFWSIKPVLSVISAIAKTIGMFLQPIAETFTLLLIPILTLLRPIVLAFNVMLAPFMSLIREMGALANQQAAAGDTGGLMQTSSLMLQTIFGGFFIVMADIVGTIIFDLADSIGTLLITAFYDMGILFASAIDSVFGTNLAEGLEQNKQDSLDILHNGIDALKTTLHTGTETMLNDLYTNMSTKLTELGSTLPQQMELNIVKPFEDLVTKLSNVVKGKSTSNTSPLITDYNSTLQYTPVPTGYNYTLDPFDPTAPGGILNPI
jgi:hypothetical protein